MQSKSDEYVLSTLEEVSTKSEKENCRVSLVKDSVTDELYIRRDFRTKAGVAVHKALQTVSHKNLPKIHHVIETDAGFVVIEECIKGISLQELMAQQPQGNLTEKQVIAFAIEICEALDTLHNMNPLIIHRDIKPSNILYSSDREIKLIDFDAAKEYKDWTSEDTRTLGTKAYAAPEQHGYAKADCRTDIYNLGATMFHLLTGNIYAPSDNTVSYNGELMKIIQKCVQFDPEKRYANVKALKNSLLKIKSENSAWSIKRKAIGFVAVACLITIVFAVYLLTNTTDEPIANVAAFGEEPNPTLQPTPTIEPQPTIEPMPMPTPVPTVEPTPSPTPMPTVEPTPQPTPTTEPTPQPTIEPTPAPTPQPTPAPSHPLIERVRTFEDDIRMHLGVDFVIIEHVHRGGHGDSVFLDLMEQELNPAILFQTMGASEHGTQTGEVLVRSRGEQRLELLIDIGVSEWGTPNPQIRGYRHFVLYS